MNDIIYLSLRHTHTLWYLLLICSFPKCTHSHGWAGPKLRVRNLFPCFTCGRQRLKFFNRWPMAPRVHMSRILGLTQSPKAIPGTPVRRDADICQSTCPKRLASTQVVMALKGRKPWPGWTSTENPRCSCVESHPSLLTCVLCFPVIAVFAGGLGEQNPACFITCLLGRCQP